MVNPDRIYNAVAALDILARADGAAFAAGRSDGFRSVSSILQDIRALESDIAENKRSGRATSGLTRMLAKLEDELKESRKAVARSQRQDSDISEAEYEGYRDARKGNTKSEEYRFPTAEGRAYKKGYDKGASEYARNLRGDAVIEAVYVVRYLDDRKIERSAKVRAISEDEAERKVRRHAGILWDDIVNVKLA